MAGSGCLRDGHGSGLDKLLLPDNSPSKMNQNARESEDAQRRRSSLPQIEAPKSSNNRVKRKSKWKLRFHHQALPAEYQRRCLAKLQLNSKSKPHAPPLTVAEARWPSPSPWPLPLPPSPPSRRARKRVAVAAEASDVRAAPPTNAAASAPSSAHGPPSSSPQPPSTIRFTDLPYMGEMTLQNSAPRRGRKPKKADICRLIYKNYGTTVVDEPLNLCVRDLRLETATGQRLGDATAALRRAGRHAVVAAATAAHSRSKSAATVPETAKSRLLLARKNRKSVAREKLAKTFEERGFLIQTQQLESAQGATYCKFRQLRKFTRYLFRSWKHHLPGDVVPNK